MLRSISRARSAAAYVTVAVAATGAVVAAAPAADAAAGHGGGVFESPFTLSHVESFSGYDVAADAAGTAYIGWISTSGADTTRKVHLCRLPVGASSCTGGVQTIDALSGSSAAGLQVVITGTHLVHLIWFHDTLNSINGPQNSAIAEATAPDGRNLTAAHDVVTDAPSFGELLTAARGPHGSIWTVTYSGLPAHSVQVRDDLSAARVAVHTPYVVGFAQLAFTHDKPVLAVERYASIGASPQYASRSAGHWGSFRPVSHTWARGTNAALASTGHGLRLVTTVNDASYRPVLAKWTGSGFGPRHLTADNNNCGPSSHDGTSDPSGRFLDVSWECEDVTVTNYPDASHAAISRLHVPGTPTETPQIASGTRGIATVVYSTEKGTDEVLRAVHVRLPASTHTVRHTASSGRVTVTGPWSCLPPVKTAIGWTHRAAHGWDFRSGSLRLDGKAVSGPTLNGATLTAGKRYDLTGTAIFAKGSTRRTVRTTLSFATCARS